VIWLIAFLALIILFQAFMLGWAASLMADLFEFVRDIEPSVPGIDRLIVRLRRFGSWTRPMQKPMRELDEKLTRIGL